MNKINHITTNNTNNNNIVGANAPMIQSFREKLEEVNQVHNFIKSLLKPGEDYGTVPGVEKPFLFKAGAEKICYALGFKITVDILEKRESEDEFSVIVKCRVLNRSNDVVSEGFGLASTNETKYYLQVQRLVGRNIPKHVAVRSLANTVLKMSEKRAVVDAVLHILGLSNVFTQDEDVEVDNPDDYISADLAVAGGAVNGKASAVGNGTGAVGVNGGANAAKASGAGKVSDDERKEGQIFSLLEELKGVVGDDFIERVRTVSDNEEKARLIHGKLNRLINIALGVGDEDTVRKLKEYKRRLQSILRE